MKNADLPAMPIGLDAALRFEEGFYDESALGVTKREYFAVMAMQSLIAAIPHYESLGYNTPTGSVLASDALSYSDELLAQLAKPAGVNDSE